MDLQLPTDLDVMTAQATKRFKVQVTQVRTDWFTVWANDKEHAAELVVKDGQGRPAGSKGPDIADVKVMEMGTGDPANAAIVENAQTEQSKTEQRLIEVVGS